MSFDFGHFLPVFSPRGVAERSRDGTLQTLPRARLQGEGLSTRVVCLRHASRPVGTWAGVEVPPRAQERAASARSDVAEGSDLLRKLGRGLAARRATAAGRGAHARARRTADRDRVRGLPQGARRTGAEG